MSMRTSISETCVLKEYKMRNATGFVFLVLAAVLLPLPVHSQDLDNGIVLEQGLEDMAESEDAPEADEDFFLQRLERFLAQPVDINADESVLADLPLLSPLLISALGQYRKLCGDLISVYELQAVPGFTPQLVRQVLPYITIKSDVGKVALPELLFRGTHTLLMRWSYILEPSKGYLDGPNAERVFEGGRVAQFTRYRYQYRDKLQYGFSLEKDAGEAFRFSRGRAGFDFFSGHIIWRNQNLVRTVVLGDFTINFGQGLLHWQAPAFKKTSAAISMKRQGEILQPYTSSGEFNFLRGAGVALQKRHLGLTAFISGRHVSGNVGVQDSLGTTISSLVTSGLNRSETELEKRNNLFFRSAGVNLHWQNVGNRFGLSMIDYRYSLPLVRRSEPYNLYALKGAGFTGASFDFSVTLGNFHFFGEWSSIPLPRMAVVAGVISSLHEKFDLAVLFRRIDPRYQAPYGNAFTETTVPSNETGIYMGISLKPTHRWKIDCYADRFYFPWMRYRTDAPTDGTQYSVQIAWKGRGETQIYSRIRFRSKPLNESHAGNAGDPFAIYDLPGSFAGGSVVPLMPAEAEERENFPGDRQTFNFRTHIGFPVWSGVVIRCRFESCRFARPAQLPEYGMLYFVEMLYKPKQRWYSGSARWLVFQTDSYDTRLYAYENNVLYTGGSSVFFDSGTRCYINFRAKLKSPFPTGAAIDLGLRVATIIYSGKTTIGSGVDQIAGNKKSEIRIQVLLSLP